MVGITVADSDDDIINVVIRHMHTMFITNMNMKYLV